MRSLLIALLLATPLSAEIIQDDAQIQWRLKKLQRAIEAQNDAIQLQTDQIRRNGYRTYGPYYRPRQYVPMPYYYPAQTPYFVPLNPWWW